MSREKGRTKGDKNALPINPIPAPTIQRGFAVERNLLKLLVELFLFGYKGTVAFDFPVQPESMPSLELPHENVA